MRVKAEEIRFKLMTELRTQFSETDANLLATPKTELDTPIIEKPKMFIPKTSGRLEIVTEDISAPIKGIGFKNTTENVKDVESQEIYSMKELITTNPDNMRTFSYDEKVVKAQLALVKKKEWQDILFEDVDWFKPIDITSGIKKLFKRY